MQAPESRAGTGRWLEPEEQTSRLRTHPGRCLPSGEAVAREASGPDFLAGRTTTTASHDIWGSQPRTAGTPGPHTGLGGLLPPQGAATTTRGHQGPAVGRTAGSGWRLQVQPALCLPWLLGTCHRGGPGGVGRSVQRGRVENHVLCLPRGCFGGHEASSRCFRNPPSGSICRLCAESTLHSAIKPWRYPQLFIPLRFPEQPSLSHQIQATAGGGGVGRHPPNPGTAPRPHRL